MKEKIETRIIKLEAINQHKSEKSTILINISFTSKPIFTMASYLYPIPL